VYYHKGSGKNPAYAEPYVDVGDLDVFDVLTLVSLVLETSAVVLKAAVGSKWEASLIKTAVKATKMLPWLNSFEAKLDMTMDEGFGLELDQRLKVIGLAIEELLQEESFMDMDETNVKGEGENYSNIQGGRLSERMILEHINLLQKAFVELNERAIGGLRIEGVSGWFWGSSLGSRGYHWLFASVETKAKQAGGSILGLLEDLEDQVGCLCSIEHVKYLIGKVFRSVRMTVLRRLFMLLCRG
jgi:hypothetical protein